MLRTDGRSDDVLPNQRLERPVMHCDWASSPGPSQASSLPLIYLGVMGAVTDRQCFLILPDEALTAPVAHYLRLHDCPAFVFVVPPSFDLAPTARVLVPAEFLRRARHIWAQADTLGNLTDGELEYLATGKLPGASVDPNSQDDAA
jgi:hypothetical protein